MPSQKLVSFLCLFFLFSLLSGNIGVDGSHHHHHHHHHHHQKEQTNSHRHHFRPTKLFVFGDSYADTGNIRKPLAESWKFPYGITFPGKPAGRFSDGRVSTDFLAKFIGVKSPTPYQWRNTAGERRLRYGMNFAYGGTGVFRTLVTFPNMTTQIDLFRQLVNEGVFNPAEFQHSMALVSVAGNDYSTYVSRNHSTEGLHAFVKQVVDQLAVNLKRIHALGVRKIAVTSLQPVGCLPRTTAASSFQRCNGTENSLANLHNSLLHQAVTKLNNKTKQSTFVILDLYNAFMAIFKNKGESPGSTRFQNPLKPCCVGVSSEYSCASVDETGAKKFTICDDRKSAFFWDKVHPTQEGWRAVYEVLHENLKHL